MKWFFKRALSFAAVPFNIIIAITFNYIKAKWNQKVALMASMSTYHANYYFGLS
jgi:uncharacterized membrane protein